MVEEGPTTALLARPRSAFAARIAGLNMVRGVLDGHGVRAPDGLVVEGLTDEEIAPGDPAVAVFRPSAVAVYRQAPEGSPRNHLEVTITELEPLGDHIRVRAGDLSADVTPAAVADLNLTPGTRCRSWSRPTRSRSTAASTLEDVAGLPARVTSRSRSTNEILGRLASHAARTISGVLDLEHPVVGPGVDIALVVLLALLDDGEVEIDLSGELGCVLLGDLEAPAMGAIGEQPAKATASSASAVRRTACRSRGCRVPPPGTRSRSRRSTAPPPSSVPPASLRSRCPAAARPSPRR